MKKLGLGICVALAIVGCGTLGGNFGKAKHYVTSTKPNAWDAAVFFHLIKPIYEQKDSLQFLIGKTKSEDPTDRVMACMLLNELIDQVGRQPTPQGQSIIQGIRPIELLIQLEGIKTNALGESWYYWYLIENDITKKHLEQAYAVDGTTRAR